jgi:hypothetical protein
MLENVFSLVVLAVGCQSFYLVSVLMQFGVDGLELFCQSHDFGINGGGILQPLT